MHWPTVVDIFVIAAFLFDLAAIVVAISRRHGVEVTLAWLLAVIALPIVGAAAYFLLAARRIRKTAKRKQRTAETVRVALAARGDGAASADGFALAPMERSLLRLAATLTEMTPTRGNKVELLAKNGLAFGRIEDALRAAERSVWAEYYLINDDETGRRFLEILAEKAAAGVEVRLLYDAIGSFGINPSWVNVIRRAGGRAEVFLPLNPFRRRWSLNLRNHRKMIIIDNSLGFTGGMNVGDEYSGRARKKGALMFRDTHLAIRGPAVGALAQIFAEDWHFAVGETFEPPPAPPADPAGSSVVAVVPSGPDQEHNAHAMVYFAGIAAAQDRVWITSPYFIPDQPTMAALITAAQRGVDVRLLLPQRCDIPIVGLAGRSYYAPLARAGVRIFHYRPSLLHAKTMVVDGGWAIVGSANVDVRSFLLNFEVGALIVDPAFAALLEETFAGDQRESEELTPAAFAAYGLAARFRDSVARLLSPLL